MPTDFTALIVNEAPSPGDGMVRDLVVIDAASFPQWLGAQPATVRAMAEGAQFNAAPGQLLLLAEEGGWYPVAGVDDARPLRSWCLAKACEQLPGGAYRLVDGAGTPLSPGDAALGWLLAQHRFDRYKANDRRRDARVLVVPTGEAVDTVVAEARAIALVRDLVDTPALDMGPAELEAETIRVASANDAMVTVTQGDELQRGFPMIHAVGMAATPERQPRLIELHWGDPTHRALTIVGKGVCFDSGGLDIKPASGMRNMKKDMGGAAHALALAELVMGARLPVRLHLLIAAVENAIAGAALRPGDVLTSRAGLTVEIANTDAEGRLILADALSRACEDSAPDLLIDFATLTGAARVALGPDLPAMFSNDDGVAAALATAGVAAGDPVWRLPLHHDYDDMLKSDVADLNNSPEGGFAGAVTAALFLDRFVAPRIPWVHLDTFAWRPAAKPGRPKGGEALGLRAVWRFLRARYDADRGLDAG